LGKTWQLASHTTGDVKLTESRVDMGPVRLDLTSMLNHNSAQLSKPLFVSLDRQIPKAVKLKPQMEKLWAEAFRPIRVAKKPLAGRRLEPDRIRFAPPSPAHNPLAPPLSIGGRARVVVSDTPPVERPTPLPPLLPLAQAGNRFRFVVPATLTYPDAANLALQA